MGAGLKEDFRNRSRQIRPEHDTLRGGEGADSLKGRGRFRLLDHQGGDGVGRHPEGLAHGDGLGDLQGLKSGDPGNQQDHRDN